MDLESQGAVVDLLQIPAFAGGFDMVANTADFTEHLIPAAVNSVMRLSGNSILPDGGGSVGGVVVSS